MAGAGMLHEHAVLTMHGHEILRTGEGQHQLLIFLEAVARHVNAFPLPIDNLGPQDHQFIDRVHH